MKKIDEKSVENTQSKNTLNTPILSIFLPRCSPNQVNFKIHFRDFFLGFFFLYFFLMFIHKSFLHQMPGYFLLHKQLTG